MLMYMHIEFVDFYYIYMCLDDLHVTCWCHLIFNRYMFGFVI